jgi:hypothetical protein
VLATARPGDVDLARAPGAVASQELLQFVQKVTPTLDTPQSGQRVGVGPLAQEARHGRSGASAVRQITHRQTHLAGDIPSQPPSQRRHVPVVAQPAPAQRA